jgi:hypothetical protein
MASWRGDYCQASLQQWSSISARRKAGVKTDKELLDETVERVVGLDEQVSQYRRVFRLIRNEYELATQFYLANSPHSEAGLHQSLAKIDRMAGKALGEEE